MKSWANKSNFTGFKKKLVNPRRTLRKFEEAKLPSQPGDICACLRCMMSLRADLSGTNFDCTWVGRRPEAEVLKPLENSK